MSLAQLSANSLSYSVMPTHIFLLNLFNAFLCNCHLAFFSKCFVKLQVVQLYNGIDMAKAWKNSNFILSVRSDFYMVVNLSIADHVFPMHKLILLSVDEILLPRYVKWSLNFRDMSLNVEVTPSCLKYMISFLSGSCRDQCLLLPAPGYTAEIWLEQVYFQEVLD